MAVPSAPHMARSLLSDARMTKLGFDGWHLPTLGNPGYFALLCPSVDPAYRFPLIPLPQHGGRGGIG